MGVLMRRRTESSPHFDHPRSNLKSLKSICAGQWPFTSYSTCSMAGLGPTGDTTREPPPHPAVALTLPTGIPPANDGVASAGKAMPSEEINYRWPLARMTRELFRKGECLFKAGDAADKL